MSDHMAKAEELIALSARLTAIIDDDIATLKNKRPAQLARSDADRSATRAAQSPFRRP
jgi:hypothetical protein